MSDPLVPQGAPDVVATVAAPAVAAPAVAKPATIKTTRYKVSAADIAKAKAASAEKKVEVIKEEPVKKVEPPKEVEVIDDLDEDNVAPAPVMKPVKVEPVVDDIDEIPLTSPAPSTQPSTPPPSAGDHVDVKNTSDVKPAEVKPTLQGRGILPGYFKWRTPEEADKDKKTSWMLGAGLVVLSGVGLVLRAVAAQ